MNVITGQMAEKYVAGLYEKVKQRWQERVNDGEFMRNFRGGRLPIEVFVLFFRDWGKYTIEINTLTACGYQKYLHFFKRHPDLMAAVGEKIADEFIHPEPPGHALIMFQTAQALGINREEILSQPISAEFRGKIDFARAILYEGTAAEWYGVACGEEMIGHWAGECYQILTSKYGLSADQAIYFSKHYEADLEKHEGGVAGHSQFNRMALQRLVETGEAWERATYGIEYCALTFIDLHGFWLDAVMQLARQQQQIG